MDGDRVSGKPSSREDRNGTGGEQSPADFPRTYTEVFRAVFPEYLAMGMSYDEFWRMEPSLAADYRKANEIRNKREEWARWRQGAYVYDALVKVAPLLRAFGKGKVEAGKYPEEPWPLTEKEAREQEERTRRQRFERMLAAFKKEGEANRKKREAAGETGTSTGTSSVTAEP